MRSLLVPALALFAASIGRADAALTLTIDTANETFTWSGSATSLSQPFIGSLSVRLGIGDWTGGNLLEGNGSLDVSATGSSFAVNVAPDSWAGSLVVASARDSLYTNLAMAFAGDSDLHSMSVTATGDDIAYSYADSGLDEGSKNYLATLDGTALFFQDDRGGAGVFNFGLQAGTIVVVPEPSASLLLLGGLALASLRRKR